LMRTEIREDFPLQFQGKAVDRGARGRGRRRIAWHGATGMQYVELYHWTGHAGLQLISIPEWPSACFK
jgi:hypothetical protein